MCFFIEGTKLSVTYLYFKYFRMNLMNIFILILPRRVIFYGKFSGFNAKY